MISTLEAKKIIKQELIRLGFTHHLTAKTIDFCDLARDSIVFVVVHGWSPNPIAKHIEAFARQHGFRIEWKIKT